jgi:poly-gamma-glutamate capsule biosynthesis protein CapA/YwtB (metallophosphatase superfamily)
MHVKFIAIGIVLFLICSLSAVVRLTPLENFDSGVVTLTSWANEDISPDSWSLDSGTPDGSAYCLKLSGNTWKLQQIFPYAIDSVGVIQVKAKTSTGGKVQGIGFTDGVHDLFYSFAGNRIVDIEAWVPVYQGAFSSGVWNTYRLPLAADWQAFFGYIPVINGIVYINDLDGVSNRSVYFDAIEDISQDLPKSPSVTINVNPPTGRDVGYLFSSTVQDFDSNSFTYEWDFGDSTTSSLANPYHNFTAQATHTYTVSLKVTDDTNRSGFASIDVAVDEGLSSLPVTMNFIGDVMLARGYEAAGGIIPTQGVNAIFTPTKPILGDVADITVANLEVILSNLGSPHPTKSVVYRGSPNNVTGLAFAGIDVVTLANNHTLDYGLDAFQQMQSYLDANHILYSGAGEDTYEAYQPTFINRRGLNIAFLRSCDRTGQYNDAQPYLQAGFNKPGFAYMTPFYVQQQIQDVDAVADLKIVEMHAGSEYSLTPGSGYDKGNPFLEDTQDEDYNYRNDVPHQWDIAIRHGAIDNGADLVIVHHPHIIQGLEMYNGKLIAHSLGNFAFDLDYPETMPSMILYADAYPDGFKNFTIKPVYIDSYLPRPATGQLGIYILDYLAQRSRELNTRLWVDKSQVEAKVLTEFDNPPVTSSAFTTMLQLDSCVNAENMTSPIKLPRRGSISEISRIEPVSDAMIRLGAEAIWYGNFEDEGSGFWAPPQYSTTDYVDGSRSAMLSTTTSSTVTSTIPKRSKIYDNTVKRTLQGWIKTNNVSTANILIRYYTNRTTGGVIGTEYVTTNISGTSDWTYYFRELTIPSNAYYYDIRLSVTGTIGAATAWFDNVGLIEWTEWATAGDLGTISWPNNYYWLQAKTSENAKSMRISLIERDFSPQQLTRKFVPQASKPALSIYPNPFNPITTVACTLPRAGDTTLRIYNLKGQLVRELVKEHLQAGDYSFTWDSKDQHNRNVASGMYFIRIDNGGQSSIRKAILMK